MAIKTINLTPTWRGLMPAMVQVAVNGSTADARKFAMDELLKLADAVDLMNAEAGGPCECGHAKSEHDAKGCSGETVNRQGDGVDICLCKQFSR